MLALIAGPVSAKVTDQARAVAVEKLRAQLATGEALVATFDGDMLIVAAAPAGSADPVASRLNAAFAFVLPVEPGDALRLPRARPDVPAELVALAYAENPAPKRRARSQGVAAIEALVDKHAAAHKVPADLAHALVQVESSYNPKATGRNGEIGLLQISPKTARAIGYDGPPKGLYDPDTNLTWGMKYLARAHDLADGDTCGTLLRYNAGLQANRMNAASSRFCAKVKSVMARRT